jgi:CSLREA domain-containing protein
MLTLLLSLTATLAADIPVTTADDTDVVDGQCSLREAVRAAETDAGGDCPAGVGADRILLGPGTYALGAELALTTAVTIEGSGGTTLDGAGTTRLLDVDGGDVVLRSLTLDNGSSSAGGAIRAVGAALRLANVSLNGNDADEGGAIWADGGTVVLDGVQLSGNAAVTGGAVYLEDVDATLLDVDMVGNVGTPARSSAAALYVRGGSLGMEGGRIVDSVLGPDCRHGAVLVEDLDVADLRDVEIAGNSTPVGVPSDCDLVVFENVGVASLRGLDLHDNLLRCDGGGNGSTMSASDTVVVLEDSRIVGNEAPQISGFLALADAEVRNTLVADNTSCFGGFALFSEVGGGFGEVVVDHVTVTDNVGGGVYAGPLPGGVVVSDSVVTGNDVDCGFDPGGIVSAGRNVLGSGCPAAPTDVVSAIPLTRGVDALGRAVAALPPGHPGHALGSCSDAAGRPVLHDAAGVRRDASRCDAGAFETHLCGDGQVGPEACDDGNTASGDGCSSTCEIEAGRACVGDPSFCDGDGDADGWPDLLELGCAAAGATQDPPRDLDGNGVCDVTQTCLGDEGLGDSDGDGLCDLDLTVVDGPLGVDVVVRNALPGSRVLVAASHRTGAPTCIGATDICTELVRPRVVVDAVAGPDGVVSAPLPDAPRQVLVQAVWFDAPLRLGEASSVVTYTP